MDTFAKRLFCWLTIGLSCLSPTSLGQDSYYFQPHPQDRDVRKGESATLECGVSNNRHVAFYWTLNGEPVANTSRRFQEGSNLHFTRVDPAKDLGEFKCIATNVTTGISLASQGAQLNILWIGEHARVVLQSPEASLVPGGELSLRCKAEGSLEVRFEWFRNGLRLFRDERVSFRNKKLQVAGLTAADNGLYSCRALSDAGAVDSDDNFALAIRDDTIAQIKVLPKDVIAIKNGVARFDCVFDNAAAVEWYSQTNDVPLANTSRYTIFPNGSLSISGILSSDEGIYKCVGISDISKEAPQQTYAARLKLAYIESFGENPFEPPISPDELKVVALGSQFEITCVKPDGRPKVKIWWEDPAGLIISDTGHIRVDESMLIVDGAKKTDTGNYTCNAENIAGVERTSLYFYVSAAPVITLPPAGLVTEEGDSATFTCEFNGSPYPVTDVRWLKDGAPFREKNGYSSVFSHNGTLVMHKVSLSDSGEYECEVVTNGFPAVKSGGATLVVKEQLKFVPPPVSTRLELGSSTKIYCKARGNSAPVVRWKKLGQNFLEDWPPHIHDDNGTLTFKGVTNEDAGKYVCIATNSQGIINVTINVDVVVMPKFIVEPVDTQAYEGYSTMLHCQALGDPMPAVQWDKNNIMANFDQNRFHIMDNGTLYVTEVHMEDEGKYGCTVGNSGGFRRAEVNLNVKSAEYYSPNNAGRGYDGVEETTMSKTVGVTLGAAGLYMGLVIGLMVFCRMRRARKKARLLAEATADVAKSENGVLPNDTELSAIVTKPLKDGSTTRSDNEAQSHSSGSHYSKRSRSSYDKSHFPRQELQTMMLLGHGEYGEVFLAKAKGIADQDTEIIVMVKALQAREEHAHFEFKREMDMLNKLRHENITKLLGICREAEPFLFITEYSDWGDLKQFLLATRRDNQRKGPRPPPLNVPQILGICHQVAVGMEHLSNQRFTHKDLATRNCLVTSRLNIKISFPSLSRDTYSEEYFVHRNRTLPLRWAPSEAVLEDEWSTKSDVWSFAVLTWELFTQADIPFAEHSNEAVLRLLRDEELRWRPPAGSPTSLNPLLLACWSACARDRPTFSDVVMRLGQVTVDSHL